MVNNINNEIYEKVEKMLKVDRGMSGRAEFFKNYSKMVSEDLNFAKNLNRIMSNNSFVKAFLVLSIKEVTWNNELKNTFNIYGSRIKEFVELMTELDFIISKPFGEIDDIHHLTILDIVSNPEYFYRSPPQIIILTEEGKRFSLELLDYIKNKNSANLTFTLQQIVEKTRAYKLKLNEIKNKEYIKLSNTRQVKFPANYKSNIKNLDEKNKRYLEQLEKRRKEGKYKSNQINTHQSNNIYCGVGERIITYPDGTQIVKKTEGQKLKEKDIKLALQEIKLEQLEQKQTNGLLTNQESKQLAVIKDNPLAIIDDNDNKSKKPINKNQVTYNGIYSNLTNSELIKESETDIFKLTSKEVKKIENEAYKGIVDVEKLKEDFEYVKTIKLNGYHNETDFKDYCNNISNKPIEEQTPEEFLDSLVGF